MDLSVAMIRARHDLREKVNEIRQVVSIPPYVMSSILSEIQAELKDEEKELLTVMFLETEAKLNEQTQAEETTAKENEDNGEDDVFYDNRESGQE